MVIGSALIVEAFLPQDVPGLLPHSPLVRVVTTALFGLCVGLVSSLLGVEVASSSSPHSCSGSVQGSVGGHGQSVNQPSDRGGGNSPAPRARLL